MGGEPGVGERGGGAWGGRRWWWAWWRHDLLATAPLEECDGDTNRGGAPILTDAGFDKLNVGHHAASCRAMGLAVNSPMIELKPAIRSLMSTRSGRTSTRSTSNSMMRNYSAGK